MKILINSVCILFFVSVQSQNYELIDNNVRDYPNFDSIEKLVLRVDNTIKSDENKVRAYYTWMAHNIVYDLSEYYKIRSPELNITFNSKRINKSIANQKRNKLAKRVFTNRKGLCLGLSSLFQELCLRSNIEVELIKGITKISIDDINTTDYLKNHAWNAVKINNQWQLIDVSFSSGFENSYTEKWEKHFNDFYFFTNPEKLINTHLPANKNFQLIKEPITAKSFFNLPIIYAKYFESGLELSDDQKGLVNVSKEDKKVRINFKDINVNNSRF
jgi:transglutaminase/protease-like cytokinesis protein 3